MPKLIIIAVGLVFAFLGYKKSWYPAWSFLFNVLIAVYVGVMITPQVVDRVPFFRNYLSDYSYAFFALLAAAVIFTVLHLSAFRLFMAVYVVSFPKLLNTVGSAVLGFLSGSVIAGFLFFIVTVSPLSDFSAVRFLTQDRRSAGKAGRVVSASCCFVHSISLQPCPTAIDDQMEKILTGWKKARVKPESIMPAADTSPPAAPSPQPDNPQPLPDE